MSKDYYEVVCKDGIVRQVWEIERKLSYKLADIITCMYTRIWYNHIEYMRYPYYFLRFCDAFEYIVRAGRKDVKTKQEDIYKAKDNLNHIKDDRFLSRMIHELCNITELGEKLKEYLKNKDDD